MKQILIIDDNKTRWKSITDEFPEYFIVGQKIDDFFDFDVAGNFCNKKFSLDEFEFVFIHHSQQGDSLIPSNLLDLIKQDLRLNLLLYSGSIGEKFEDLDRKPFFFRSIPRDLLTNKLRKFIKDSTLIGRWEISLLFYNYPKLLIGKFMEMLDDEMTYDEIFSSEKMKEFLILTHVKTGSEAYKALLSTDRNLILEKLEGLLK